MKCPTCAEIIQEDAVKCRFCGQTLTKAARLGWPDFYRHSADLGYLDPEMFLWDCAEHLGLDLEDSCLDVGDPIGRALDDFPSDTSSVESTRIGAVLEVIRQRLEIFRTDNEESAFLMVMMVYLRSLRKFLHPASHEDPRNFKAAADQLQHQLDSRLPLLNESSRQSVQNFIGWGIKSLLARAGNQRYCTHCGSLASSEARFCTNCGRSLGPQ